MVSRIPNTRGGSSPTAGALLPISRREFLGYAGAGLLSSTSFGTSAMAGTRVDSSRANMAAAVKEIMAAAQIPSMAYAVIGRDGTIWAESVGVIDKLSGTAPSVDTLYAIGSCSKVFATVAVMKLVEQGKIELDKPLVSYVPDFRMLSGEASSITVRMLMNHSSGLPGSEYRGIETLAWHGDYPRAVMQTIAKARLKHKPGELSVYCNDGFTLLEPLVAAVTGTSFPAFVRQEILKPLGMTRSQYGDVPIPAGAFAPAFDGDRRLPLDVLNAAASGGLYTNPTEWGRFTAIFLNEGRLGGVRVLKPESVRQMAENQSTREPFRPMAVEGFGLGWDSVNPAVYNSLGLTAWRKNGGTSTHSSDMIVVPDAGLAVVLTVAKGGIDVSALSDRLMFEALTEQGTLPKMPPQLTSVLAPDPKAEVNKAWFDGAFANYVKLVRFQQDASGTLTQFQAENGVWRKVLEGLHPQKDGFLASEARPDVAFRLLDYQGLTFLTAKALSGYKSQAVELPGAQRLVPQGPLRPSWRARNGQKWLVVNQPLDSFLPGVAAPAMQLNELPGLEGYMVLHFGLEGEALNQVVDPSGDDYAGRMCLKIPFNGSRDLNDVILEKREDGEWLRYGSWLGRPLDSVQLIGFGTHVVKIGNDGSAEWRRLADVAGIDIAGSTYWGLHDTNLRALANGAGDVKGLGHENAGYLVVYGAPGSAVTITLA